MVQNKPLVQQVVVVAVPALAFQSQKSQQEHMPFTMANLGSPIQCRMDDGKSSFQSSLERLLTLPATKSQKQQLKKQARAPPKPPSDFALSLDKMRQLDYPMPVRIPSFLPCDGATRTFYWTLAFTICWYPRIWNEVRDAVQHASS